MPKRRRWRIQQGGFEEVSRFSRRGFSNEFACRTAAPVLGGTLKELRMFVDKSSIEIFANGGRTVMTNIVFPSEPYKSLTIESSKKTKVKSLDIYDINI